MAKIPFDIKYRPQIESGEYKVELKDGTPVSIIYWDAKGTSPVIGLFLADDGCETTTQVHPNGRWSDDESYDSDYDLFIVTPEEELFDWEKAVGLALTDYQLLPRDKDGIANIHDTNEFIKKKAAELLSLAREQLIKDGYVIEKRAFHDAVEKVDPEMMKEVSEDVDLSNFIADLGERYPKVSFVELTRIAKAAYDFGKTEVLKGLPRWKRMNDNATFIGAVGGVWYLCYKGYGIELRNLEKLPGFKEE